MYMIHVISSDLFQVLPMMFTRARFGKYEYRVCKAESAEYCYRTWHAYAPFKTFARGGHYVLSSVQVCDIKMKCKDDDLTPSPSPRQRNLRQKE